MRELLAHTALACAFGVCSVAAGHAQVTVGAHGSLNSRYMFSGLTLSNRPVIQPDLYVTVAGLTVGLWGNFELTKDAQAADRTSGGSRSGNTEVDYWIENNRTIGPATVKIGVIRWTYNQENTGTLAPIATQANFPGLKNGPDINTTEIYGAVTLPALPLSPNVTVYYDVDIYKGLFGWASLSQDVAIGGKKFSVGALAGYSIGESDRGIDQIPLFSRDGLAYIDLSVAFPVSVGTFSALPNAHFQINVDDATKLTSGTVTNGKTSLTIGLTLSWSRVLGGKSSRDAGPTQ